MKRYSISSMTPDYNKRFQYDGRTDNPEEVIESYKNNRYSAGIRIVDSLTKEVVFEDKREIKGELRITFTEDGKTEWTSIDKYVNLSLMQEEEHKYKFGYFNDFCPKMKVVNVERVIY